MTQPRKSLNDPTFRLLADQVVAAELALAQARELIDLGDETGQQTAELKLRLSEQTQQLALWKAALSKRGFPLG